MGKQSFRWILWWRMAIILCYQMLIVASSWQVYALTDSVMALGLIGLAEVIPFFLTALLSGYAVDRYSRRRLQIACSVLHIGVAILLLCSAFAADGYALSLIYLAVALIGIGRTLVRPLFQSLMHTMVPKTDYAKTISMSSSFIQVCLVLGPALAGMLIALTGLWLTYAVAAFFAMTAVVFSAGYTHTERETVQWNQVLSWRLSKEIWTQIRVSLSFVRRQKLLLSAISLDMFAVLLAGSVALLPAFVKDVLHMDADALGWLRAAPSLAAALAGMWLAASPPQGRIGGKLLLAVFAFGGCIVGFGLSTSVWSAGAWLFLSGIFDSYSVVIRSAIAQLLTPPELLGRTTAITSIFISSSNELGGFESGVTAAAMGLVPAIVFGGVMAWVVVLITYRFFPELGSLTMDKLMQHSANKPSK